MTLMIAQMFFCHFWRSEMQFCKKKKMHSGLPPTHCGY